MNAELRRLVWRRSGGYCEYCRLHQQFDSLPHHVDHIVARKHRGQTSSANLALACANCSLAKGANIAGQDPRTKKLTRLFHPRDDQWSDHFRWNKSAIVGKSAIGRVTILVLNMNLPERRLLRKHLMAEGVFPP